MKRRTFLQTTAISLPALFNGFSASALPWSSAFSSMDPDNDRVLVLVRLKGGNDGLNTLIPLDQYVGLTAARSELLIPENQVLKIDDHIGLHPSMQSFKRVFDEGKASFVQSVGYPNQNRSHFRSTDIWTSASDAEIQENSGWLGRYFEERYPDYPEGYPNGVNPHPFAITIGKSISQTCQGSISNFSLALQDPFALDQLPEGQETAVPDSKYGIQLEFLRTAISQSNAYATVIQDAANQGNNLSSLYGDDNNLAQQLKTVALLISGGLSTKIYVVSLGGFDTHGNQVEDGDPTTGRHAELLQTVSDAIYAFQDDLKKLDLEDRVMGMTFSEFGRRIRANGSFGTDHGTAAPMMLFGNCLKPLILGDNPEIAPDVDAKEGVPMQYDFRSVYGSVLMDWFGVEESEVKALLHDEFQYLSLIECPEPPLIQDAPSEKLDMDFDLSPNPAWDGTTIIMRSPSQNISVSLFNSMGSELMVIADRFVYENEQIHVPVGRLLKGNYYIRMQNGYAQKTKRLVVL